ncbi:glycosyltransferase [uncultured Sphaerotilus sp.]|uniref:glycosyltransferase n=1 Tax=uncultured Sphaerotilus sp. TaxID=474984 RepID=UPI0030CA1DD0
MILLTHPAHMPFNSIHRFSDLLLSKLHEEGISASMLTSRSYAAPGEVIRLSVKILRYIDQYFLFPCRLLRQASSNDGRILYIFVDQALGPWIPLLSRQLHCIYVHDFAALRKSRGYFVGLSSNIKERINQSLIAAGVKRGRCFICISEKSKQDLLQLVSPSNLSSLVVIPNALNSNFQALKKTEARKSIGLNVNGGERLLVYVGTCAFNKNVPGLLYILAELKKRLIGGIRLLMISELPDEIYKLASDLGIKSNIIVYRNVDSLALNQFYSAADLMIMPSIHEGFGWPLIEAQACGTPVITTDESPMRDVAGPHSLFIPPLKSAQALSDWAETTVSSMIHLLDLKEEEYELLREKCIKWAQQFQQQAIYRRYFDYFDFIAKDRYVSS